MLDGIEINEIGWKRTNPVETEYANTAKIPIGSNFKNKVLFATERGFFLSLHYIMKIN